MVLFAALIAVIAAWCFALRLAATAGDKKALRHLRELQNATPSHTYTDHNGTEGRWP